MRSTAAVTTRQRLWRMAARPAASSQSFMIVPPCTKPAELASARPIQCTSEGASAIVLLLPGQRRVVDLGGRQGREAGGHVLLELGQPALLPGVAVRRAREVDELVADVAVAQDQRGARLPVLDDEDEALAGPAEPGPGQLGVDDIARAAHRAGDQLEAVARARAAERGADVQRAPLARPLRREQRQRALEHLAGMRHAARRLGAVVAQQVGERELQDLALVADDDDLAGTHDGGRRGGGATGGAQPPEYVGGGGAAAAPGAPPRPSASSATSKPSLRARRSKYTNMVTAAMNGVVSSDTMKLAVWSTSSAANDVSSSSAVAGISSAAVAATETTETRM